MESGNEKERSERGSLAASSGKDLAWGTWQHHSYAAKKSRSLDFAPPLACAIADAPLGMTIPDGPLGGQ